MIPPPPHRTVSLLCASVLFDLKLAGVFVLHESQLIHYVMRNARVYADSIRILNVTCVATRLGRDFSNLVIPAQAHKTVHNFKTTHASAFKLATLLVKRSH